MNIKRNLKKISLLVTLMMLALFVAGCGRKTYASLEEYVQSNPIPETFTNMSSSSDGVGIDVKVEFSGNTAIAKCTYSETFFGVSAAQDAQLQAALDQAFSTESQKGQLDKSIQDFAQASGIDASLITIRYEFYNPNASTPSYSISYPN